MIPRKSRAEKKRAYRKAWRLRNLDKVKAYSKAYGRAYYRRNRDRVLARQKAWYLRDPEKMRRVRLTSKYGLSWDQYLDILNGQGGACLGCDKPGPDQVDHDHSCCPGKKSCGKCVRGILCGGCNLALGSVNDSLDTIMGLAAYLDKNRRAA